MMRESLVAVMSQAAGMIQTEPVWNPWCLAQQLQQLVSLELSTLTVKRLMLPASQQGSGCMGYINPNSAGFSKSHVYGAEIKATHFLPSS